LQTQKFSIKLSRLFAILLTFMVVVLISYNYYKSYNLSYIMLDKIQKEISYNVINITTKTLEISSNYVEILSKLNGLSNNIIGYQDILINLMFEQLKSYSYINSIYIANNRGDFIQIRRYPQLIARVIKKENDKFIDRWFYKNNNLETIDIQTNYTTYNPISRVWYKIANKRDTIFWSEPYIYATEKELGITVSRAIFDKNNTKTKVAGADITYQRFNKFLKLQSQKIFGDIIIFDKKQNIIASSFDNHQSVTNKIVKLNSNLNPTIINKSYTKYLTGKKSGLIKSNDGVKYLYFFYSFPKNSSQKWKILTLIPQDVILGDIVLTMYTTITISILVLIIFIFIVAYLSKRISKPITLLSYQIRNIEHLHLNININEDSKITEIREVQHSLKSLQTALSSFIKYIPVDIVKILMELNQEAKIGGEEKNLAIMFTDIENFTTISENMNPSDVAIVLSEYFDKITSVIQKNNGTVDKYIGDAVLAFWGAPKDVDNPILLAVKTLIEIHQEIDIFNKERQEHNQNIFKTRVSVHYGKTLVGNIGSTNRLNYTVIGDSVNTTARLESINKKYGTYNIISDEIYEHIKDDYKTKYLDSILLKGKTKPTKFYTIIL